MNLWNQRNECIIIRQQILLVDYIEADDICLFPYFGLRKYQLLPIQCIYIGSLPMVLDYVSHHLHIFSRTARAATCVDAPSLQRPSRSQNAPTSCAPNTVPTAIRRTKWAAPYANAANTRLAWRWSVLRIVCMDLWRDAMGVHCVNARRIHAAYVVFLV